MKGWGFPRTDLPNHPRNPLAKPDHQQPFRSSDEPAARSLASHRSEPGATKCSGLGQNSTCKSSGRTWATRSRSQSDRRSETPRGQSGGAPSAAGGHHRTPPPPWGAFGRGQRRAEPLTTAVTMGWKPPVVQGARWPSVPGPNPPRATAPETFPPPQRLRPRPPSAGPAASPAHAAKTLSPLTISWVHVPMRLDLTTLMWHLLWVLLNVPILDRFRSAVRMVNMAHDLCQRVKASCRPGVLFSRPLTPNIGTIGSSPLTW